MAHPGELTLKQQRFVEEYLIDGNGTQAAIRAGYSKATARQIATENLAKPAITVALGARTQKTTQRLEITVERVLLELGRIAFSNIRNVLSWDGSGSHLLSSAELSEDASAAISEVTERHEMIDGRRRDDDATLRLDRKIKMYDKQAALNTLAKHLDMFPRDSTVTILIEDRIRQLAIADGLDPDAVMAEAQGILARGA